MEKRVIPTCVTDNRLSALFEEQEISNNTENFLIKNLSEDDFFKNKSAFVLVDENIFSEIQKKKMLF